MRILLSKKAAWTIYTSKFITFFSLCVLMIMQCNSSLGFDL